MKKNIFLIIGLLFLCTGCSTKEVKNISSDAIRTVETDDEQWEISYEDSGIHHAKQVKSDMVATEETQRFQTDDFLGIPVEVPEKWTIKENFQDVIFSKIYTANMGQGNDPCMEIFYFESDRIDPDSTPLELMNELAEEIRKDEAVEEYCCTLNKEETPEILQYTCSFADVDIIEECYLINVYDRAVLGISFLYHRGDNIEYLKRIPIELRLPDQEEMHLSYERFFQESPKDTLSENPDIRNTEQMRVFQDRSAHSYYTYLSQVQANEADAVAQSIADTIISNPAYTTDLQRVTAAAEIVAKYCAEIPFGIDEHKYYRSPYGVFVAGAYTCAGSTRALGRVLDYMGFSWSHVHENENRHQWCVLTMDGQKGFADGMAGVAGYGEMVNGMTMPDGRVILFNE